MYLVLTTNGDVNSEATMDKLVEYAEQYPLMWASDVVLLLTGSPETVQYCIDISIFIDYLLRIVFTTNISCGSSLSKIVAENQQFSNSGSESRPQQPPHQSPGSGSSSISAFSTLHSDPGSKASKTVDEAASAAVSATEACDDDAGDVQFCDPWNTGPAAVALRLLRDKEQPKKSPTPAHATPATGRASSADEMALQRHIYETAFGLRVKLRISDKALDQMAQIHGLQ
ncbi:hypothetical protein HPB49_006901 [Dermacentor silvarum]|uniref:Uncharacterized protein n=1 Tax=Dermacentor silvarum TaxID=543639 RepID=A0ACB8C2H4_DERSI|nr:hypothetical protein HPB49_006901 [Dermacentor silvarum]